MSVNIYLDNAATTPLMPEADIAMRRYYSEDFFNPSAVYSKSKRVKEKLEEARNVIAGLIGAREQEIYFTSGGTESDNWAVNEGVLRRGHIITDAIEHKAVLNPIKNYIKAGGAADFIGVTREGFINPADIKRKILRNTVLISVMTANNEIGTIQPIAQMSRIAHEYDVLFHTDAVQAFGHIPLNVDDLGVDMLSASSHKFNGPKGVGFIYIRKDSGVRPFMCGGGQEKGMRAGTENVAGIIGMAEAARISCERLEQSAAYCRKICRHMTNRIMSEIPDTIINGTTDAYKRLPGNMSFGFGGVDAQSLLVLLDMHGISAAAGSACTSDSAGYSHVLEAVKTPAEYIGGTLRLSIDAKITRQQADYVVSVLREIIKNIRSKNN
ncbi:MAG: cysteine desulfurase [Butyrivibrio sp.]|nr:cysteine desulfurase [Butyrivibrio sp.]